MIWLENAPIANYIEVHIVTMGWSENINMFTVLYCDSSYENELGKIDDFLDTARITWGWIFFFIHDTLAELAELGEQFIPF